MLKDSFDYVPGGGAFFDISLVGPDGRLSRLCKGGDNGAAAAAEAARLESQRQFELSMKLQKQQMRLAASSRSPEFSPASPPLAASSETAEAGLNRKRQVQRRFGTSQTILAGEKAFGLGSSSTLGTQSPT